MISNFFYTSCIFFRFPGRSGSDQKKYRGKTTGAFRRGFQKIDRHFIIRQNGEKTEKSLRGILYAERSISTGIHGPY